ncbi:MAG: extracellular solute-binding protein, partial [Deltaproteobacteria bacterium]|nr:extracellular solute-binding protein [Deltaproteobacteria bacterium]
MKSCLRVYRLSHTWVASFLISLGMLSGNALASPEGQKLLNEVIAKAKKEGVLDTAITSGIVKAQSRLIRAFNKRFGMNIEINMARGNMSSKFVQLHATLKTGGVPAFDTLTGTGQEHVKMKEAGFSTYIDNWQTLLAEINPLVGSGKVKPEEVSPAPFSGYSFMWSTRSRSFLYNKKLISESELPKSVADLANPKFKGKFSVPPWTSMWEIGILVYDKDKWLNIADQTGKNAGAVLRYGQGVDRMILGEFAFQPTNTYYYWQKKAKDPKLPLGQQWFSDYTPMTRVLHLIPKNSKHPAAATLWAMWMTTPEAQAIWQPVNYQSNAAFGQSDIDKEARRSLKASGSKVVTWYDSSKTI